MQGALVRHSKLQTGGHELSVYEWGTGPAVLLSHGFGGHAGQLRRFVPALLAAGYRVVAFDQPAHGLSGRFANLMVFARAIDAVARKHGPFDHGRALAQSWPNARLEGLRL